MEIIDLKGSVQVACYFITNENQEENKRSIRKDFRQLLVTSLVWRQSLVAEKII